MIALLLDDSIAAHGVLRHLRNVRPRVDGPFMAWDGRTRAGLDLRVVHVPPRIDDQYVAGRLQAHHGARLLVHLGMARGAASWMEEESRAAGEIVLAGWACDLRALEPVQRILPDTTPGAAVELPAGLAARRVAATALPDVELGVGSLALPLTVAGLAERLRKRFGLALFDTAAAGLLEACVESGVDGILGKVLAGSVCPGGEASGGGMAAECLIAESMDRFLEAAGLVETTDETLRGAQAGTGANLEQ
ncbi:MAG: hypothetical protein KF858_10520 [Candidatus Sumerlaeia bacterium]|nr:hypothetical protein [Candidatus Sumerlaeia bacterium]